MAIVVQRLPGNKKGEAVVSSVLTTPESQLERGRFEVNKNDRDRRTVAGETISSKFLQPAQMKGLDLKGKAVNGLLTNYSYSLQVSKNEISTQTMVVLETIA